MKLFEVKPVIYQFSSVTEFLVTYALQRDDLLLTIDVIYRNYFETNSLDATVVLMDKYGNEEPTDIMIDTMITELDVSRFNRIFAVGGGACMDVAKLLAASNGLGIDAMFDQADRLTRTIKLILVPTTCGTGSEITGISAVNRTRLNSKAGISGPALFADDAVLIPELISALPHYVFATSSIDALIHAVESFLSPNATPISRMFSEFAIRTLLANYRNINEQNTPRAALSDSFLLASTCAGIAFSIGGCAAVHAMSYQLGGKYHVPHGESNYVMFIEVLNLYEIKHPKGERLHGLKKILAEELESDQPFEALDVLLDSILKKKKLREYGAVKEDIQTFAKSVVNSQQRLTKNNYYPLNEADYEYLFEKLFEEEA